MISIDNENPKSKTLNEQIYFLLLSVMFQWNHPSQVVIMLEGGWRGVDLNS